MQRHVEVRVTGVVQGVGFRPFVHAQATAAGLVGHVGNDSAGVFVDAQGDEADIQSLLSSLGDGPRMAVVESITVRDLPLGNAVSFTIAASTSGMGTTSIPPDTAVCDDCLLEMRDPRDRRYGYPFIACTNCGPRYTIVERLPYDRPGTTMSDFPLCRDCQEEYEDPASRRFHAQPTACPDCGPRLTMPVDEIAQHLHAGRVLAIKGVGGYHLVCDARDTAAVDRLRERKKRGSKPFAVMVRNAQTAGALCRMDDDAVRELEAPERPIVLVPSADPGLQSTVAPGNGFLGILLPYAPLHHLLFDAGAPDVLVMTSGNISDEPLCTERAEAEERLAALADVMVHHDRRIHIACDDSVVRALPGALQPVRRSRGFAPLPITLPMDAPPMLAVGGEVKSVLAVAQGHHSWLSQHIGDTENLETLAMLARTAATLMSLQGIQPSAVVSDAHPGYLSRRWAAEEARQRGVPHLTVQHHHAHVASLLAEHQWEGREPVLGVAFDGTGYGTDGTIWGGELLLGGYAEVERVGHLAPVSLPGGDAAVRRPLRTALAHLHAAGLDFDPDLPPIRDAEGPERSVVARMLETGTGCTPTTSVGRLFDAVASLLGVRHTADYEGQAAIELEALADTAPSPAPGWRLAVEERNGSLVIDPAPALAAAIAGLRSGVPAPDAAAAFHEAVAEAVAQAAVAIRTRTGVGTVGLTGGVFANAVLTRACQGRLGGEGFTVLTHRLVPPNDGGLALGQVAVAASGGARAAEGSI